MLAVQSEPLDIPVEGVEGRVGGDEGAMRRKKGEADDVAPAENQLGFRLRRNSNDATLAADRCCDVEIARAIERKALGAAKPA